MNQYLGAVFTLGCWRRYMITPDYQGEQDGWPPDEKQEIPDPQFRAGDLISFNSEFHGKVTRHIGVVQQVKAVRWNDSTTIGYSILNAAGKSIWTYEHPWALFTLEARDLEEPALLQV